MGVCAEDAADDFVIINDPFALKEKGNKLFAEGSVAAAIDVWKQALKAALKRSVRHPSFELTQLQTLLRMNLALGFMKDEDFVMAKEHMLVVYDNAPHTPKIFYRLAAVYRGLHDERRALDVIKGGLDLFPGDAALIELRNEIVKSEMRNKTELKDIVDLSKLSDERETSRVPAIDVEELLGMEDERVIETLIEWRYKSTQPISAQEVMEDVDDWRQSSVWRHPYTPDRLVDDKTVIHLALPFSILAAIESLLRRNEENDRNLVGREFVYPFHSKEGNALPSLPVETCGRRPMLREQIARRLAQREDERPFTVHVLGARGDHEMEAKWSAILQRLPHCQHLQVVMIGFIDPDDQYNRKLPGDEYLSPPLVKNAGVRPGQKFTARLYKGTYHQFCQSPLVAKETRTENLKPIVIPLKNEECYQLPPVLAYDTHPLNPDLIVLPEPNFSRHFDSWIPSICPILLSHTPMIVLGHSALGVASHEALQIPAVMKELHARPLTRLLWNPFLIAVQPTSDMPPMPLLTADGEEILYSGLSAKFAVVASCQSIIGGSPEEVEDQQGLLAELAGGKGVEEFRRKLKAKGVDVDRENVARTNFFEDKDAQQRLAEDARKKEELIERQALAMATKLTERIAKKTDTEKE